MISEAAFLGYFPPFRVYEITGPGSRTVAILFCRVFSMENSMFLPRGHNLLWAGLPVYPIEAVQPLKWWPHCFLLL